MLSEDEKQKIRAELLAHERPAAGALDALKIVQRRQGWVSDEAIVELAPFLNMTPAELDAVATFYPFIFRHPVGRHVVYICDAVSCWISGYEGILAQLKNILGIAPGETTEDGRFTLLPVSCIGACDRAPAMIVDEDLHGELTAEKIAVILERYQ
ncbi:MAG: NADH-quinone oxidoreductase subunit NuoE [Smithellaceae bacterium]|nr:NADH-quinone oxidoreductase subunit NuoE [Smithellaceae bacterium]